MKDVWSNTDRPVHRRTATYLAFHFLTEPGHPYQGLDKASRMRNAYYAMRPTNLISTLYKQ